MFYIWGSYGRNVTTREEAMCSRCDAMRTVEFQRTWRTVHFFFFPLFSHSEAMTSRCVTCNRQGVAYFPRPLAPLPLLDRMGIVVPVGVAAVGLLALVVKLTNGDPMAATSSRAPHAPSADTASSPFQGPALPLGSAVRARLEAQRASHVASPDEAAIVKAAKSTLETSYKNVGRIQIIARVAPLRGAHGEAGAGRRAIVLIEVGNFRHSDDRVRDHLLEDIRASLARTLAPTDEAVVGIRGLLLYGAMAAGPIGAPWKKSMVAPIVTPELDEALDEVLREDGPLDGLDAADAPGGATRDD